MKNFFGRFLSSVLLVAFFSSISFKTEIPAQAAIVEESSEEKSIIDKTLLLLKTNAQIAILNKSGDLFAIALQSINSKFTRFSSSFSSGFIQNKFLISKNLDSMFSQKVFIDESTQEKIKNFILDFLDYLDMKKSNVITQPCGHILYIIGNSGTGKTHCAEAICNAILVDSQNRFVADAASVSEDNRESYKKQLFSIPSDYRFSVLTKSSGRFIKSNTIAGYIFNHPRTVVIINEYDKFCDKEMDEALRSIKDTGKIKDVSEGNLSCDQVLFIITSNESKSCFPTKFSAEELKEDDKSLGTTFKKHDISFSHRLCVIHFKKLTIEQFKKIAEEFICKKINFYESKYGLKIKIKDSIFDQISISASESLNGARYIVDDLSYPLSSAFNKAIKKYGQGEFELDFKTTENTPKFKLKRIYTPHSISSLLEKIESCISKASNLDMISSYVFSDNPEETMSNIKLKSYLSKLDIQSLKTNIENFKKDPLNQKFLRQSERILINARNMYEIENSKKEPNSLTSFVFCKIKNWFERIAMQVK